MGPDPVWATQICIGCEQYDFSETSMNILTYSVCQIVCNIFLSGRLSTSAEPSLAKTVYSMFKCVAGSTRINYSHLGSIPSVQVHSYKSLP